MNYVLNEAQLTVDVIDSNGSRVLRIMAEDTYIDEYPRAFLVRDGGEVEECWLQDLIFCYQKEDAKVWREHDPIYWRVYKARDRAAIMELLRKAVSK